MNPWDAASWDRGASGANYCSVAFGIAAAMAAFFHHDLAAMVAGLLAGLSGLAAIQFSSRAATARDNLLNVALDTAADAHANIPIGFGS